MNKKATSNAVDSVESEMQQRKARKPRDIYFVGIVKDKSAQVPADTRAKAEAKLKQALSAAPTTIYGPFYEVKGTSQQAASQLSVTVPARSVRFTPRQFEGIWNGWHVIGNGLQGVEVNEEKFGDDDLIQIQTFEKAVGDKKTNKPRLQRNAMARAADFKDLKIIAGA